MKRKDAIFILLTALFLIAALCHIFTDRNTVSDLENRTLAELPRFSFGSFASGGFQEQLEESLGDHLPFSEEIRGVVKSAEAGILRLQQEAVYLAFPELRDHYTQISDGYYTYAGDKHRIVEKPSWNGEIPEKLRTFASQMESLTGIRKSLYWINNSRSISFDLPEETQAMSDAIFSLFPGTERTAFTFDGYAEFCGLFYQTDHHWNHRGSYKGYTEILSLLRPKEEPVPVEEEITFPLVFNGSYARQTNLLCADEHFSIYRFDLPKMAVTMNGRRGTYGRVDAYIKGKYADEPLTNHYSGCYGGEYGEIVYETGNPDKGILLLIASSYSNPINGLIASHFSRTYVIDPRYYAEWAGEEFDAGAYISEHEITDLLLLGDADFFLKDLGEIPSKNTEGEM